MTDILFDTDGDLLFVAGDIAYGESTLQHQRDLLLARKGDYRNVPTVGVGIADYLNDDEVEDMQRAISREFGQDGMQVDKVFFDGSTQVLTINASYDN